MSETSNEQDLARDHARFKQLIRSAIKAFFVSIVVGLIGGYLIYKYIPSGRYPAVILYVPGLLAVLVTCLPIRKRKNEWFPTPESLKAAAEYKTKEK